MSKSMLIIKALDPDASLMLSTYTGQWYVSANIEIGDGAVLSGVTKHCNTPEAAIEAFLDQLTSLDLDEFVVTRYRRTRREWRWNGAAFAECTRDQAPVS